MQANIPADEVPTVGVYFFRQLQSLTGGHIYIGWSHGKDDAVGVFHVFQTERSYLLLDIFRLVTHRHFGDTGKINQGQIENTMTVNF